MSKKLRSLLARITDLQAQSQARIAGDLQEELLQLITAARYEIKTAQVACGLGKSDAAVANLDSAREVLDQLELEVRRAL